ncbi:MAG TPA: MltR family transcriptional regulator, partial [Nitrososphaera sp.]|nr:MltR family transcriptional regulator [Nitrososphaera sp.]
SMFLVDDEGEVGELLGTEKPLGAFGARIRAAYCMGLLSKEDFEDLKIIKAIRNDFAHQLHGLSFNEASIAKKCEKLRAVNRTHHDYRLSPRQMFVFTRTHILMELCLHSIMFEERRCLVPPVTEVMVKPST